MCRRWFSGTWENARARAWGLRAILRQARRAFYGEFLVNAQGEDVVAGIRTPQPITELEQVMPEAYKQLRQITANLEKHYRDVQDFEFTIEEGKLYMLQTRNGKRTGPAAVRIAVDMVDERLISKKEAVQRVAPNQLDQLLHPVLDPTARKSLQKIATGLPASPGAAVGRAAFSAEDAVKLAADGPVVLVRKETTPDDIHGMDVSKGILTAVGGLTSHAAVVARGMGRACVVGASSLSVDETKKQATILFEGKKTVLNEGDWISLDGTLGEVYLGECKTSQPDPKSHYFATFMKWADEFRGNFGVRANADIPRDAEQARASTELKGSACAAPSTCSLRRTALRHMQAMILARDEKTRREALQKLLPMQRRGFRGSVPSDGWISGDHSHARSAAARVPSEARECDGRYRQASGGLPGRKEGDGEDLPRSVGRTQEVSSGTAEASRGAARI